MPKLLVADSTETMLITPLNSFNQIVSGFTPAANTLSIIDDTSPTPLNYPVQNVSWDNATNVGTLTFKTPAGITQAQVKNLTVKHNGEALNCIPNPLTITLMPPYRGNFILTNAILATDFRVVSGQTALFDYSGNNNSLVPADLNTFQVAGYSEAYSYRRENGGTTYLLDGRPVYNYYLSDLNIRSQWTDSKRPTLKTDQLPVVCSAVNLSSIPVKTISVVFAQNWGNWSGWNINQFVYIFRYACLVSDQSAGLEFSLKVEFSSDVDGSVFENQYNPYLILYYGTNNKTAIWSKTFAGRLPGNGVMNLAKLFTLVITPVDSTTFNLDVYLNDSKVGSLTNLSLSSNDTNRSIMEVCPTGLTYGASTYVSMMEMALYSDAKNSTFVGQLATSWGL